METAPSSQSALPNPKPVGANPAPWWVAALLLALPIVVLFLVVPYQHWYLEGRSSVLTGWARIVSNDDEWWFCLLVPPLVGWLIWRERAPLRSLPLAGSWWGLPVLMVALFFYWAGQKVDTGYLGFVAMHLTLAGLILLLGGGRWMRALFFPWLFLGFMWPLFPLEERLAFPLRMLTAAASGVFLNGIGVDVVREGTALHSAAEPLIGIAQGDLFRLDVEEPCSGIRSLFSLMMISALYGYLSLRSAWARLALFLSAIPLAMLGNFTRMVLLAVASRTFGSEFAVGRNIDGHQEMSFFHTFAGFAVFGVALAGMFAVCGVLEGRFFKRARRRSAAPAMPTAPSAAGASWKGKGAAAVLLPTACVAFCLFTRTSLVLAEPGLRLSLPAAVDAYLGKPMDMSAEERNVLDEGVELARTFYASPTGRRILVTLIVGGPGKRTLHRPEVCLPGQGWSIGRSEVLPLTFADGRSADATVLHLFRDTAPESGKSLRVRALNLYWYIGSDGSTRPDYYGHISKGYQDALFKGINHRWSMLSLFIPVSELPIGTDSEIESWTALEETQAFLRDLVPELLQQPSPP